MQQGRSRARGADAPRNIQFVRFGEFLRDQSIISDEQLLAALGDHWSNGGMIGSAMVRSGFLSQDEVERHAARFHSLDVLEV
jgi:hypothetical protein